MRVLRRKKTFTRALNCIFLFVKSQEEMFKKMYRISNIPNLTMARFEIDLEERKRHEHSCGGLKYVSSISLFIAKILQMRTRCYSGVNHLCCVQTLIGVTFLLHIGVQDAVDILRAIDVLSIIAECSNCQRSIRICNTSLCVDATTEWSCDMHSFTILYIEQVFHQTGMGLGYGWFDMFAFNQS